MSWVAERLEKDIPLLILIMITLFIISEMENILTSPPSETAAHWRLDARNVQPRRGVRDKSGRRKRVCLD